MMRTQGRPSHVEPETLYEQGHYLACRQVVKQPNIQFNPVLAKAAEMLAEIFKDSPRNLYFGPNVRWRRVKSLAEEAAKMCSDQASRGEFEAWCRIAEVYSTLPKPDRAQIEGHQKNSKLKAFKV
jgi:hypothetical protein